MKKSLLFPAITLLSILFIFVNTNPVTAPSITLILPFLLLFLLVTSVTYTLLRLRHMPKGRAVRLSLFCALIPVAALVLQSIGQLTIRDALALGAFLVVLYFYMSRTKLLS